MFLTDLCRGFIIHNKMISEKTTKKIEKEQNTKHLNKSEENIKSGKQR